MRGQRHTLPVLPLVPSQQGLGGPDSHSGHSGEKTNHLLLLLAIEPHFLRSPS